MPHKIIGPFGDNLTLCGNKSDVSTKAQQRVNENHQGQYREYIPHDRGNQRYALPGKCGKPKCRVGCDEGQDQYQGFGVTRTGAVRSTIMRMIIRSCRPRTARGKFTWPTAQRRYNSKANGSQATMAMVLSTQGITSTSMNPRRAIERPTGPSREPRGRLHARSPILRERQRARFSEWRLARQVKPPVG